MSLTHRAKTIVDVGSSVLVTAAALALLWTLLVRNPVHPAADPASPARSRVSTVEGLTLDLATASKRIGESSVVLIEFSDFQCPFCARHSRETFPSIRRELVDKGKLTYISFAFPRFTGLPCLWMKAFQGKCKRDVGELALVD
jgi:protein-disulfide isomerase